MSRTTTITSTRSGVRRQEGDRTARWVAALAAVGALAGGVLTYSAAPVAASEGPQVRPLRALCQADDGVFFMGQ